MKAYNEYKYLVTNEKLSYVKDILHQFLGGSDPFDSGVVDSIYFDTPNGNFLRQCQEGDAQKLKFRLRGYGDGNFHSIQVKKKDLFGVRKLKHSVHVEDVKGLLDWHQLLHDTNNHDLIGFSHQFGPLLPAVRIRYNRERFRQYDYRITLDSCIEAMDMSPSSALRRDHMVLPEHVLEVKTFDDRPMLPLLNLLRLPQVSFSKFYFGLHLLDSEE